MMWYNILLIILSLGGWTYGIIKIYKLIKKGESNKKLTLKAILYTQFYEPFMLYDLIKLIKSKREVKQIG